MPYVLRKLKQENRKFQINLNNIATLYLIYHHHQQKIFVTWCHSGPCIHLKNHSILLALVVIIYWMKLSSHLCLSASYVHRRQYQWSWFILRCSVLGCLDVIASRAFLWCFSLWRKTGIWSCIVSYFREVEANSASSHIGQKDNLKVLISISIIMFWIVSLYYINTYFYIWYKPVHLRPKFS